MREGQPTDERVRIKIGVLSDSFVTCSKYCTELRLSAGQ
jgi:hypothetical protein